MSRPRRPRCERLWPEVSVVSSHQITREWREYERTNTAVLSAYVQPVAERYLQRLQDGLTARGLRGQPLSSCSPTAGWIRWSPRPRIPITMVESGPASGFWGAAELGELIGEPNVLALDIGGTTAKCSLIENGEVRIMTDYWIERDGPRPAIRSWCRWSIWSRSAMAAARSPGWMISASCMSGRNRRAPCRGRRPMAAAAPGHDDRRQPVARPDQPRLFLRRRGRWPTWRRPRRRYQRCWRRSSGVSADEAARGHHPHRQQQHGQCAEAGVAEPRL